VILPLAECGQLIANRQNLGLARRFHKGHLFLSRDFWIFRPVFALPPAHWRSFRKSRSSEMLNVSAVSERMLRSSARIICASNCSLRERVRLGKFREDLYQRLNGLTLLIPPLRERVQETTSVDCRLPPAIRYACASAERRELPDVYIKNRTAGSNHSAAL
jgi:hypothetical protein